MSADFVVAEETPGNWHWRHAFFHDAGTLARFGLTDAPHPTFDAARLAGESAMRQIGYELMRP